MSEQITHIAFYDDVVRLISSHTVLDPIFSQSLAEFPDFGVVATGSRGNHLHAVPLLEKARNRAKEAKHAEENKKMVAACAGWLMHRAIDLVSKPISLKNHKELMDSPKFSSDEGEIYQDAVSMKEIFEDGNSKPVFSSVAISPLLLSEKFEEHSLFDFFHTDHLEELMALSFTADNFGTYFHVAQANDQEESLLAFHSGFQEFTERVDTYVQAYQHPNPEKVALYLDHFNYYDMKDPMIQVAAKARKGSVKQEEIKKAATDIESQSIYAQGLAKALYMLENCSLYYRHEISKDSLYDAVENFHQPHRI